MRRSLSGCEKAFCLSEPLVPINFAFVVRFTSDVDEAQLRLALNSLQEHYPMAALRLEQDEHGKPWFTSVGVPGFPLHVVEQACEGHWQQIAARELGKNFDLSNGPLVRTVLIKRRADLNEGSSAAGADLILTFHHGIADGMSAVYFLRDLLCLLIDSQADLPVVPQSPDLLELIPETAKHSLALKTQILGMKSGLWLMQHFPSLKSRIPPADRIIDGRPPWEHFRLVSRCLTPAQTDCLAAICREKDTSIHAAICTAWLRARLETSTKIASWKRVVSSPVNLRGRLNAENAFGLYMSNVVIAADCRPNRNFWNTAREIKIQLDQDIQTGRVYRWVLTMIGMMDASPDAMRQAVPAFATQPVNYDFSITNLGRLSLPAQANSLKLESVYGPIVNTSEQEMTVGISTALNCLTMTLTYRDFVLDPVEAEKMADSAVDILGQAARW